MLLGDQEVAKMQQNHIKSTHETNETHETERKKPKPKNHTVASSQSEVRSAFEGPILGSSHSSL
jgi:hypothetical protein